MRCHTRSSIIGTFACLISLAVIRPAATSSVSLSSGTVSDGELTLRRSPSELCAEAVASAGAANVSAILSNLQAEGFITLADVDSVGANRSHDSTPGLSIAANLSFICGAGSLYLPPARTDCSTAVHGSAFCSNTYPGYVLNSTLVLQGEYTPHFTVRGSQSARAFMSYGSAARFAPLVSIGGPSKSGTQMAAGITLQDLNLRAGETGVMMYSVARVRLLRVFIDVEIHTGSRNNCAVVVVNAYWIQMQQSNFIGPSKLGDQPVVVLRGDVDGVVGTTYLVRMEEIVITYGGIRYEQMKNIPSAKDQYADMGGFFFFNSIVLESSGLPLFEVWSDPSLANVTGVEQVTIIDYQNADSQPVQYSSDRQPVVAMNCSQSDCVLDGLNILGASAGVFNPEKLSGFDRPNGTHPAVRVYAGRVQAVTISGSHFTGASNVVDNNSVPVGNWAARNSGGGWTMVSDDHVSTYLPLAGPSALSSLSNHTILLGKSGEAQARLAIDADGAVYYGPGGNESFEGHCSFASMCRAADKALSPTWHVHTHSWDPPKLSPGGRQALLIDNIDFARRGSVCHASHDQMPLDAFTTLVVNAGDGFAKIFLKNEDEDDVDVAKGIVKVACLVE